MRIPINKLLGKIIKVATLLKAIVEVFKKKRK